MPAEMSVELQFVVWSVALCVLQMLVAVIAAQVAVGLPPLIGNRDDFPILKGLPGRAQRAHRNMAENLVLFVALVMVVAIAGRSNAMTLLGSQLFFWARVAYAVIYLLGIPWARTGAWAVSMVGLVLMFLQVL
jgi:uncharacterized MAPEG superfamily protein